MKRVFISMLFIFLLFGMPACLQQEGTTKPEIPSSSTPDPNLPGECTRIGQTWTSPVDGVTLVCVPAGEFLMGASDSDPLAMDNEKPQHRVTLDAYWIDRTEVTNAEFAKCLDAGVCHPQVYETTAQTFIPYAVHPNFQNYPAFLYDYEAVNDYCQWVGRRLPTEAEWEKAARGMDERLYPWGNTLDCSRASYFYCNAATDSTPDPTGPRCGYSSDCKTNPVDAYPSGASPYGSLNMAGNVWEWTSDWYQSDYYTNSPMNNPRGPATGKYRVIRGGGANSLPQDLRVTRRSSSQPEHFLDGQLGFRCAADASNP